MPHYLWQNVLLFTCFLLITSIKCQDYDDNDDTPANPAQDNCVGVFLTYTFTKRTKEYPHVKNATAQAYAFDAQATILNTMSEDLKAWEFFVGFQHSEILVSIENGVLTNGTDFPVKVGNGTTFSGFPDTDLLNAIDTAGDMDQIQKIVKIKGTQFGVKPPGTPMPKTIKLMNDGFKCPAPTRKGGQMYVCCVKDPKIKKKTNTTRFLPRQKADLTIAYDVLQAYGNNYLAQVTIDNWNPLGRLDNWNLTWEWKRGEFIHSMRGAYTLKRDSSSCIYSQAASYYTDFDFSPVMSCDKKPIIVDLPPKLMNSSLSTAMFQLQVYKMPPDLNRTTLYPPQNWKIQGELNPNYVCGLPIKVDPMEFPDPSGLMSETAAVASWQVGCNITLPKPRQNRCCVSFSAYYNESVIPCNTCACGCSDALACDPDAQPLLLPSEALLIPFVNRTAKAKAWAKLKHRSVPNPLPCGDNCGVSINWHIVSNYRNGWSARITLFNWKNYIFKDWFTAVTLNHDAFIDFEKVYSFNGTKLNNTKDTVFMQGLEGLNYLVGIVNATPPVPGKQQTVISFTKKKTPKIKLSKAGFPTKVYFNGEECALPNQIPRSNGYGLKAGILRVALAIILICLINMCNLW